MQRPFPKTASPDVGYLYLKECDPLPSFEDVLTAAFSWIGTEAVGYAAFPAQSVLAIIFPTSAKLAPFVDKKIPELGLQLYVRPPKPVELRRYTLSNVPMHDTAQLLLDLRKAFAPTGDIVDFTPLKSDSATVTWFSDTVYVTVNAHSAESFEDGRELATPDPDPIIRIMDADVYVDIPGKRKVCRFCNGVEHTNPLCRQGQRQKQQQIAPPTSATSLSAAAAASPLQPGVRDRRGSPSAPCLHHHHYHHRFCLCHCRAAAVFCCL
jgi:hypothetical protein